MKVRHQYSLLCLSLTLIMTGCATNQGSFDLDNVVPPPAPPSTSTTPTYVDDTSGTRRTETADANEPALGFAIEIPRRNTGARPITGTADSNATVSLSDDKVVAINHKLSDLPKVFSDKIEADRLYVEDNGINYSHDRKLKSTIRDLDYVRSGYVIGEKRIEFIRNRDRSKTDMFPAGQYGYVFYQGVNPATSLPTTTATYKGTWDFVSDAKKSRTEMPEGFSNDIMNYGTSGNATGATTLDTFTNHGKGNSKPVGLTSEFTVDFAGKKLTGTLTQNGWVPDDSNAQTITDRYTIDATIKGNRFTGNATAKDSTHEIFGKNSDKVEGGFFGPNAEELAGKFMASEGSLFAVFAGKRGDAETQNAFDANKISTSTLNKSSMDTFGNVAYLVIDGKRLPLLPKDKTSFADMDFNHSLTVTHQGKTYQIVVCCNNLDYVKFGSFATQDGSSKKDGHLFLIGERTPVSAIPLTGTVHYRGTWEGFIHSKDGKVWNTSASNSTSGSRSRFDFNFANKSFTGKLIADNGLEDIPTFALTGIIQGNGFTGTAKTRDGGFNIDGGSTAGGTLVNIEAVINGGFYGPNASEIGGTISGGKDDKVGGVFGGKRQVQQ